MDTISVPPTEVRCAGVLLFRDNKYTFGVGKCGISLGKRNGIGGRFEKEDGSIEATAIRELAEEAGLRANIRDLEFCGTNIHEHPEKISGLGVEDARTVRVDWFILRHWSGEPQETKAMGSYQSYHFAQVPYAEMLPDVAHWLRYAHMGREFRCTFRHRADGSIRSYSTNLVEIFA